MANGRRTMAWNWLEGVETMTGLIPEILERLGSLTITT